MQVLITGLISFCLVSYSFAGIVLKKRVTKKSQQIISVEYTSEQVTKAKLIKSLPEFLAEGHTTPTYYQEWLLPDSYSESIPSRYLYRRNIELPKSEVKEIIKQGPYKNRINLTILGDGYTANEKSKFYQDVDRIVNDLFKEVTFKSYLPLFNIYAIFTPSKESGITDRVKKNTVFGLYRSPKGSKRGVMPGNRMAIESALRLVDYRTDYPIIIANDPYYGGLGGRYAITTSSITSGSMVLRHELGHNFSNVGEEYDGGVSYFGANFSRTTNITWNHWLSSPLKVNKAMALTGEYIWKDLTNNAHKVSFNFPSNMHYFNLKTSSVGWATEDDVATTINNTRVKMHGVYTKDRSFFESQTVELKPGRYELKLTSKLGDRNNVLAYARSYAYPRDYDFSKHKVDAFSVYNSSQRMVGYRPTHKMCLMRDMRSKVFCPVDQENIWVRFLDKVNLIDQVEVNQNQGKIIVHTPKLKGLHSKWWVKENGSYVYYKELDNRLALNLNQFRQKDLRVQIDFKTSEIRKKTRVTTRVKEIKVP